MSEVIDVSFACGSYAGYLAGAGVRTVIRYYSRDTGHPEKRLTRPEASAFAAAGLRLAVVHEAKFGDRNTVGEAITIVVASTRSKATSPISV